MPKLKTETKKMQCNQRNRFKLSLKKNKTKFDTEPKKLEQRSDMILLDESFDRLRAEFQSSRLQTKPKTYSPIVINDSCELTDDDLPKIAVSDKEPSMCGNVSFNCLKEKSPNPTESRPSIGGWSPAQHIICATPRNEPIPTTPKDTANESYENCSMKKIQQSQKKLLDDLYGDQWKSIPSLFKTISRKYENIEGISKKLHYDDEENKNIRHDLQRNKELYLTGSDLKRNETNYTNSERKSKKKLFTEKVPSTPNVKEVKPRVASSTTKKKNIKSLSVTELVAMNGKDEIDGRLLDKNDGKIDKLTKKIESVYVTPVNNGVKRLSFMGSLADNIPSWRCHPEALQYRDSYKTLREQLTRRLFQEFNKAVFDDALDADMPVLWDGKLRSTAGTTTNRLIKNAKGDRIRTSSIKLSTKVVDAPQRLRDTLVHELCHAATWLLDAELRAGHGPLWRKWAATALRVFPELGEISRCHDLEIHYKYSYKCTKCGYSIQRHSKSIDVTKKCCGYCRGTFEIVINKKNKDGVVVSTPARKGATNQFAKFVKDNYAYQKEGRTHAQVMKILGEQFAARKNVIIGSDDSS